jgi:hypothetical protein
VSTWHEKQYHKTGGPTWIIGDKQNTEAASELKMANQSVHGKVQYDRGEDEKSSKVKSTTVVYIVVWQNICRDLMIMGKHGAVIS